MIPVDKSVIADPNSSNPLIAAMGEFDTQVTMDGADYVIEFTVPMTGATGGVVHCAIAFELSEYGKRVRKIIQGCGYQIDFASAETVSVWEDEGALERAVVKAFHRMNVPNTLNCTLRDG